MEKKKKIGPVRWNLFPPPRPPEKLRAEQVPPHRQPQAKEAEVAPWTAASEHPPGPAPPETTLWALRARGDVDQYPPKDTGLRYFRLKSWNVLAFSTAWAPVRIMHTDRSSLPWAHRKQPFSKAFYNFTRQSETRLLVPLRSIAI